MVETAAPPSTPGQEQRRSKRFRSSLVVELKHGSSSQRVRTIDVSRHGLFVETHEPPSERFLVQLQIHLPDGLLPATAFVSRKVGGDDNQRVPGVGLQLFALSASSKQRWDQFVFSLAGLENKQEERAAEERTKPRAPNSATFLIKLRDVPRLAEFYEKNVRAGGLFMATPLIKETGADVALIIIHPITEAEFTLLGKVDRVCRDRPKGMEIKLERLTDKERAAFKEFVRTGQNSMARKKERPDEKAALDDEDKEKDTGDISVDIVVDEDALEESRKFDWSEISNQELIVDDFALVEDEAEARPPSQARLEALIGKARESAVTVRLSCTKCQTMSRPMVFGGLGGILGVFAARRPYWCPKCEVFVSVPRLRSPAERKKAHDVFSGGAGDALRAPIELAYAFELAAISGAPPRCPDCSGGLRVTRAVKDIQSALAGLAPEGATPVKDARCKGCGAKALQLVRADEVDAHVRIEEPVEPEHVDIEEPVEAE